MRAGSITSAVYALASIATAVLSAQILGTGIWAWLILAVGLVVGASPYYSLLLGAARGLALISAILTFLAIPLGLLAATTGGSFRLPSDQALLLFLLGLIGVFGIAFFRITASKVE